MGWLFFTGICVADFGFGPVGMASTLAFRQDTAKRLDARSSTHDLFVNCPSFLVASDEPRSEVQLWCCHCLRLHHCAAHQHSGGAAHLRAASVVLAVCGNSAALAFDR